MRRRLLIAAIIAITPVLWTGPANAGALDKISGPFTLVDQFGNTRSDEDFRGRFMLIFFGYANCRSICSVGLRHMTAALDRLGEADGSRIQPILITVDPQNDTPPVLARAMAKIHPRLLGLTGTATQLRDAYRSFGIESKQVSRDADGSSIYAHGSFI